MSIPKQVTKAAYVIGGYLGVTAEFYDETGFELAVDKDTLTLDRPFYLVSGNYYGSDVFHIARNGNDVVVRRVEPDDE